MGHGSDGEGAGGRGGGPSSVTVPCWMSYPQHLNKPELLQLVL